MAVIAPSIGAVTIYVKPPAIMIVVVAIYRNKLNTIFRPPITKFISISNNATGIRRKSFI
jgi:hypothetical protein